MNAFEIAGKRYVNLQFAQQTGIADVAIGQFVRRCRTIGGGEFETRRRAFRAAASSL